MLNALVWIGEILVGTSIVSTGWLLSEAVLGMFGKAKQTASDPVYHATAVGNQ